VRYGSVCSGIEAASCAWEPLGWTPVFFAEIEKFPSSLLAQQFPTVPNLGDITKYKEWPDANIDVLVGGTPCQAFSVAGLRGGLTDPRGNLTLTFLGILDRFRPRWFLWENVPGVLSSRTDGRSDFGTFLDGVSELGYGYAWRVLDLQHAGVPQRRRRVFVVGHSGDWRRAAAVLLERESMSGNPAPSRAKGQGVAPTISARTKGGGGLGTDFDCDGGLVPGTLQANGKAAGSATQQDAESGMLIAHTSGDGFWTEGAGTLRARAQESHEHLIAFGGNNQSGPIEVSTALAALAAHAGPAGRLDFASETFIVAADLRNVTSPGNRSNPQPGDPCHTLHKPEDTVLAFSSKDHGADAGKISPTLRSMGHDGSHANGGGQVAVVIPIQADASRDGVNQTASADAAGRVRKRDAGLGVGEDGDPSYTLQAGAPVAIAFNARQDPINGPINGPIDTDPMTSAVAFESRFVRNGRGAPTDLVPPLKAQSGQSGKGDAAPLVATATHVRRITPTEAERLMGFPDGWTDVPYRGKPAADGPRYKALGNSMGVPEIAWIGRRIELVDKLPGGEE
jgi:DNA (cytosine-5)-methyltransferase 1